MPHSYQCAGKAPAKVIIVTMHQPPAVTPMRAAGSTSAIRPLPVTFRASGHDEKHTGNF